MKHLQERARYGCSSDALVSSISAHCEDEDSMNCWILMLQRCIIGTQYAAMRLLLNCFIRTEANSQVELPLHALDETNAMYTVMTKSCSKSTFIYDEAGSPGLSRPVRCRCPLSLRLSHSLSLDSLMGMQGTAKTLALRCLNIQTSYMY